MTSDNIIQRRIELLARCQLRGWIIYPQEADTPASVRERGLRLQAALDADDQHGIALHGIRSTVGHSRKGRPGGL